MLNHSDGSVTNSTTFNKLKCGKLCSVKLKFQRFNVNEDMIYATCKTFDGCDVLCRGNCCHFDANFGDLKKGDEIELKHVLVKFIKERPNHVKNDLIFIKKTEIYANRDGSKIKILAPKSTNSIQKLTTQVDQPKKGQSNQEDIESTSKTEVQNQDSESSKEKTKIGLQEMGNSSNERKLPQVSSCKPITVCSLFGKCTITLKIESYTPDQRTNFIFIMCLTSDDRRVTIVANIRRHDEDTKLEKNDLVQFFNVIRVQPKKADLGLKIEKNSKIYLLSRNDQFYDVPKEMLEYKIVQNKKDTKKTDSVVQKRGVLETKFKYVDHWNSYFADLRLSDGKLVKLAFDENFGNWPHKLLNVGDPVVFCAAPLAYLSEETYFIRKGDHFDYDNDPEKGKPVFTCPICFEEYLVEDGKISCTPFEDSKNDEEREEHEICVDCIRGIAKAALTDTILAPGGSGLPCCVPECENVFLMSKFKDYLDAKVHDSLMLRMQHESILAANMDDVVTCPDCSKMFCVDRNETFYVCPCGKRRCRHCPRLYDLKHFGKTCKRMDQIDWRFDEQSSAVVVRQCPKCHLQFVKSEGCNKMTCRCGTSQCYLCRAVVQDYSHFCQCGTKDFDKPCPRCFKVCPLMGDANQYDQQRLEQIKKENIVFPEPSASNTVPHFQNPARAPNPAPRHFFVPEPTVNAATVPYRQDRAPNPAPRLPEPVAAPTTVPRVRTRAPNPAPPHYAGNVKRTAAVAAKKEPKNCSIM